MNSSYISDFCDSSRLDSHSLQVQEFVWVADALCPIFRVTWNVPPVMWAPAKTPEIALLMDLLLLLSMFKASGGELGSADGAPSDCDLMKFLDC